MYYLDFCNTDTGEIVTVISGDVNSAISHLKSFYGVKSEWLLVDFQQV